MNMRFHLCQALIGATLVIFLVAPARAIDPPEAKGVFYVEGEAIPLTHAHAHLHDNAEGVLDRSPELRILLADREVRREVMEGLVFLPVEEMARQGEVRGLLIQMTPEEPNEINITYLEAPGEPGMSLMNQSFSTSGKDLWEEFTFHPQRVSGSFSEGDIENASGFTFTFSAPVFNEHEVTADLKGKDAKKSPHADMLQTQFEIMKKGDLDGLRALQTKASKAKMAERMEAMGLTEEKLLQMLQQMIPMQKELLSQIDRVVERGNRATVIYKVEDGQQWTNLVREEGVWKSDN